ncbi:hypothetical protein K440DRAFT_644401 [Wilcoxina mikolae CBS 423.85]|nr:hypothetical protein K440DRAFT_644401 [Wilcoxina mikolae CBS 423.85]
MHRIQDKFGSGGASTHAEYGFSNYAFVQRPTHVTLPSMILLTHVSMKSIKERKSGCLYLWGECCSKEVLIFQGSKDRETSRTRSRIRVFFPLSSDITYCSRALLLFSAEKTSENTSETITQQSTERILAKISTKKTPKKTPETIPKRLFSRFRSEAVVIIWNSPGIGPTRRLPKPSVESRTLSGTTLVSIIVEVWWMEEDNLPDGFPFSQKHDDGLMKEYYANAKKSDNSLFQEPLTPPVYHLGTPLSFTSEVNRSTGDRNSPAASQPEVEKVENTMGRFVFRVFGF